MSSRPIRKPGELQPHIPLFEDRIKPHLGRCRACNAQMIWCEMYDDAGQPKLKGGKPVRNPLNVNRVEPVRNVICFNYLNGHGIVVNEDNLGNVLKWTERGASCHTSHFSTCEQRGQFKRPR